MKKSMVILVSLLVVTALSWPRQFQFSESIVIHKSPEDVFSYLVNLESWKEWSPWSHSSGAVDFEFEGLQGVVGSYAQWHESNVGDLKQTLTSLRDPQIIVTTFEMTQLNPMNGTSTFILKEVKGGVELLWTTQGTPKNWVQNIKNPFMGQIWGSSYKQALERIKTKHEIKEPSSETPVEL